MPQIKPKTVVKGAQSAGLSVGMIVTLVGLVILAILSAVGFSRNTRGKKFKKIDNVIYLVAFAVVIAGTGAIAMVDKEFPVQVYGLIGTALLVLGILHVWLMYLLLSWSERDSFLAEGFFTLYVGSVGSLGFVLLFYFLDKQGYGLTYNWLLLLFPLPYLMLKAYDYWMQIDFLKYEGWKYPESRVANSNYSAEYLTHKQTVFFILSEVDPENKHLRHLQLEIDPAYQFGEFFHFYIYDKSRRRELRPIQHVVKAPDGTPLSWMFFVYPKKWWQRRRFIDPDLTFRENNISHGQSVVALRVPGSTYGRQDVRKIKSALRQMNIRSHAYSPPAEQQTNITGQSPQPKTKPNPTSSTSQETRGRFRDSNQ